MSDFNPEVLTYPLTLSRGFTEGQMERLTVAFERIAEALQTLAKIEPKPEKRKEAHLGTAKYDKRSAVEKEVHEHFAASGGLPKPKR